MKAKKFFGSTFFQVPMVIFLVFILSIILIPLLIKGFIEEQHKMFFLVTGIIVVASDIMLMINLFLRNKEFKRN